MRIGILTGGGDVPGLNPCIKALVLHARALGWDAYGFRRGWKGPLRFEPSRPLAGQREWVEPLTEATVRVIDRSGGTYLHTSRTNPGKVKAKDLPPFLAHLAPKDDAKATIDCTTHILKTIETLGIDAMIPIGGDDTLSYGARLAKEGVKVVAIPKTMDNDVHGTDYCIGFSTAVSRSVEFIHALRTPAGSHERIAVIELFGRNSGETALVAGHLADADRVLISEVPFAIDRLAELVTKDRLANPSRYAVVVVSEGAKLKGGEVLERGEADAFGHKKLGGIGPLTGELLKARTGIDVISQQLAYLMRAGAPDSLDRMVATAYAQLAIDELAAGRSGKMVAVREGVYTTVPIETCVAGKKQVDIAALYDPEAYRPRIRKVLGSPMFLS
ncbi:MAG: ATP-dependent 6-phosphofructokinase [Alphaproteobacteria bacterium]|nr:ATP-dependent 6-phosphofructokinase [Alphaproteobacteria bacterium]